MAGGKLDPYSGGLVSTGAPPPKSIDELGLGHLSEEELAARMDYDNEPPLTEEEKVMFRRDRAVMFAVDHCGQNKIPDVVTVARDIDKFLAGG